MPHECFKIGISNLNKALGRHLSSPPVHGGPAHTRCFVRVRPQTSCFPVRMVPGLTALPSGRQESRARPCLHP